MFLVARPFYWYFNILPPDLDIEVDILFKNIEWQVIRLSYFICMWFLM
jgi:hypothetical protein